MEERLVDLILRTPKKQVFLCISRGSSKPLTRAFTVAEFLLKNNKVIVIRKHRKAVSGNEHKHRESKRVQFYK